MLDVWRIEDGEDGFEVVEAFLGFPCQHLFTSSFDDKISTFHIDFPKTASTTFIPVSHRFSDLRAMKTVARELLSSLSAPLPSFYFLLDASDLAPHSRVHYSESPASSLQGRGSKSASSKPNLAFRRVLLSRFFSRLVLFSSRPFAIFL